MSIARVLFPSESVAWRGDGLPLDMFWLLALLGWATAAWHDRRVVVRAGWIDLGVAIVVGCAAAAAIRAAMIDAPRSSINMLWSWLAMGAGYWLWRQLVADEREARTVVAVMLAIAVGISGYGLYQYFVSLPADRAMYLADPDAALAAEGLNFPPGTIERELFEQRLFSTEPPATFALANSLAGWLVPWLLLASVVGWLTWRDVRLDQGAQRVRVLAAVLVIVLVAGFVLVLTKSRSAIAGLAVGGMLLLVALMPRGAGRLKRAAVTIAAVAGTLALLLAVGVFVGGVDREVLSEAPKSLGFRWQYWQSTARMIAEHPWLGCGPGNFGDHYTRFKLPTASEEITDPHNLFLEVAATAGLPAAIALALVLLGTLWLWLRGARREDGVATTVATGDAASPRITTGQKAILGGAAAGLMLAWLAPRLTGGLIDIAPGLLMTLGCAAAGATIVWLLWPWVERGRLATPLLAAAALALAFNLLAAGGISFPAVAGSLWMLIAVALDLATEGDAEPAGQAGRLAGRWPVGRAALSAALIAALLGVAGCYWTGYRPVAMSMIRSSAARAVAGTEIEPQLEAAAASDPYAAQPQLDLAHWYFERWLHDGQPQSLASFETAVGRALELRPHQSSVWLRVGQWYRQLAARTGGAEYSTRAVEACRRAVELYPNHARERAVLALACREAGKPDEARRQAAEAWQFDAVTPHADQRLHESLRQELIAAGLGTEATTEPTTESTKRQSR
ncbi:MAG: O-antigen ligase family protein [Pirellulales bacterium]